MSDQVGLTTPEHIVLSTLAAAWNAYVALPGVTEGQEAKDFADGIHKCQRIMAMRVARRANPEVWR